MSTRKGPDASAASTKLGTRKRGNDGAMWEVKAASNGVHRWVRIQPTRKGPEISATKVKPGTRRRGNDGGVWEARAAANGIPRWVKIAEAETKSHTQYTPPDASGKHRLVFCEPFTQAEYVGKRYTFAFGSNGIVVSDAMYRSILRGPTRKFTRRGGNAYVFGAMKPISTYKLISDHGNDIAQTGLIDVTRPLNPAPTHEKIDALIKLYIKSRKEHYKWDDRVILAEVRKTYPWLVFLGETVGGDVGAGLYAHYNSAGEIDSLIINSYYFSIE